MNRAALSANPLPDPKSISAFWAADALTCGTGLGCKLFIDFQERNPCVIAFVFKKIAKHEPTHVEGCFASARFDLPCGRDVSNEDRTGVIDDGAGIFVESVLSAIGDLGVNAFDLPRSSLALGFGELWFEIAVERGLIEIRCIDGLGNGFEAKIDADDIVAVWSLWPRNFASDFASDVAIPSAAGVLGKVAGNDPAFDLAMEPETKRPTGISCGGTFQRESLVLERNPPRERLPRQRNFGRLTWRRLAINSRQIAWMVCDERPRSLPAPLVKAKSSFSVIH